MGTSTIRRGPRHNKKVGASKFPSDYFRFLRQRARAAYQRLGIMQKEMAEAWGESEGNTSKRLAEGGSAYRLAVEIHTLERLGKDTTPLLTYLTETQAAARAGALSDDEIRQRLLAALQDEHEAEAVESRGAQHFERTGCYLSLIETTAPENAVQTKRIALASVAHERRIPWRAR